jgi:predicted AlkP superfamily pyrophosphatase or phosphodiesterase
MKKLIALFIVSFILIQCIAVKSNKTSSVPVSNSSAPIIQKIESEKVSTKLVVGIVVDQMRYDYLIRFYAKYGNGGFKRLMQQGYNLENVHFNYVPTKTAVGHSSIYTGTTPENHGILGNDWYDKYLKKSVYCVGDNDHITIGASTGGNKSPHRLISTTITDQLKLAQNMNGKTIGISLKDRGAILPVGHTADAAYWFEGDSIGKFITSSYYMNALPEWVSKFNNAGITDDYLNQTWTTYLDIAEYTESMKDNNIFEGLFNGKKSPTFPYKLSELRKQNNNFNLLKEVPAGNSIVTDFSMAAIKEEKLGKSEYIDFLAISYSSTDYIGHQFGPRSIELEDTYIRMDKELEKLINFLDEEVGMNNYTIFLTADHAVVDVPAYLKSLNIPAGYFNYNEFRNYVNDLTFKYFNSRELVENISNEQLYLNKEKINSLNLDYDVVTRVIADELLHHQSVYKTFTARTLHTTQFTGGIQQSIQKGYNQKYSGDILLVLNPSTISRSRTGTTHGSGYTYDTHVPLLFYGNGIQQGSSDKYYPIVDIIPTISSLLKISNPEGCTGKPIIEALK